VEPTWEWKSEWVNERDSVEVSGQENQCGWQKDVWCGRQGENDSGREWVSEWLSNSGREKISKLKSDWLVERLRDCVSTLQKAEGMQVIQSGNEGWKLMFSQRYYEMLNYSEVSRRVVGCVVPRFSKNGTSLPTHDFNNLAPPFLDCLTLIM
jgi:hypothetical protein